MGDVEPVGAPKAGIDYVEVKVTFTRGTTLHLHVPTAEIPEYYSRPDGADVGNTAKFTRKDILALFSEYMSYGEGAPIVLPSFRVDYTKNPPFGEVQEVVLSSTLIEYVEVR